MVRIVIAFASLLALAGCSFSYGGPGLISGNSPAAANSLNAEPQTVNSLPPGAEGLAPYPYGRAPNYGSITTGSPI